MNDSQEEVDGLADERTDSTEPSPTTSTMTATQAAALVGSVVCVLVGGLIVLAAVDALAGEAWSALTLGLVLLYTGFVLSTKHGQ